ncbi:KAP family P-loop NTPase fold protein [Saccharopolyspora sp. 5N708]|uniref:KAP family P-loop NTPase fold protein n=1 Tax=Saccharopolyspora sp. 5N708 TaxID=3457424 RepID=UPI003FD26663
MPQYSEAEFRSIVLVDVASFSDASRRFLGQLAVHRGLEELLERAFDEAGVGWHSCEVEDRGDGKIILVPPNIPRIRLADQLWNRLLAGLRRHNAVHSDAAVMQLRVALHAGDVRQSPNGKVSPAINFAARILDARDAKSLQAQTNSTLGLIASEDFFRDVIEHDQAAEPDVFRQISVVVKETSTVAWLRLSEPVQATASNGTSDGAGEQSANHVEESIGTEVRWSTDSPANKDALKREALAKVLAGHIRASQRRDPYTSLLIHLDGEWGSGKSTLLRFLSTRLQSADSRGRNRSHSSEKSRQNSDFLIVWFDAWQQSRMSPPWWALLTATRSEIARDRGWWARRWFRIKETWARVRRSGAPYLLALVLLVLLAGGLGFSILQVARPAQPWAEILKILAGIGVVLSVLWAGAKVASRFLLWDSARGAQLFEQYEPNPMLEVSAHFDWCLRQSRKPVVFFIDDIDRCKHPYVVELLDSIQTLVRDAPRMQGNCYQQTPAAYFVISADGSWLRKSYEIAYETFGSDLSPTGGSLGYQFLDKLFQLTVPMPALGATSQNRFLGSLLGVAESETESDIEVARDEINQAIGDDEAVLAAISGLSPNDRGVVAEDAVNALFAPETQIHTEHALRKFARLLPPNPRSTKLFLNTYSILRAVRTLEGGVVNADTLALWTIIRIRWPRIADILRQNPEAIKGIREPLWRSELLPDDLHPLTEDEDLQQVVAHDNGGPLTPMSIRQCCGNA